MIHSHLSLAHHYWKGVLNPNDNVIDATCGNGHDTLFLVGQIPNGHLYAFDIQPQAIANTKSLLTAEQLKHVHFFEQSHQKFPDVIPFKQIKLIVYNLGYLPGGNKELTTQSDTTLDSLKHAMEIIQDDGLISVTCYPGHPAGQIEEAHILNFLKTLHPWKWTICHHTWINRQKAPSLLIIQKKI